MATWHEVQRHPKHPLAETLREITGLNWHQIVERNHDAQYDFIGRGLFTEYHFDSEDGQPRALILTDVYELTPRNANTVLSVFQGITTLGHAEIDNIARLTMSTLANSTEVPARIEHMRNHGAIFTDVYAPIRATYSVLVGNYYHVEIEANDLNEAYEICRDMIPENDARATFVEASREMSLIEAQALTSPTEEQKTAGNIIDAIYDEITRDGEQFTDADVIANIQQILKGWKNENA